jgi:hypothetical protein
VKTLTADEVATSLYALIEVEWGSGEGKEDEPTPFNLELTNENGETQASFLFYFPELEDANFRIIVRKM